jgi:hypothetical protein
VLEIHMLRPHFRSTESESLRVVLAA